MRRAVLGPCVAVLLGGPAVLAFFDGGFFDRPRLVAAIVAWVLVAVAAVASRHPVPAGAAGRAALCGLALLYAWTALSLLWAPLAGPAFHDLQRLVLYLGALIAAAALLRDRRAARAIEPALAAGALAAVLYGLSERLLPGVVDLAANASAQGRLDQPLGYWNGMGALSALGIVLSVRLAGDGSRPPGVRAAAAAAAVPLGTGLYLTFSRGALAALAVGLLVLVATAPDWPQVRALALSLEAAAAGAVISSRFDGVDSLAGSLADRERDGAVVLVALIAVAFVAALLSRRASHAEGTGRFRVERLGLRPPPWAVAGAVGLIVALTVLALASGGRGEDVPRTGAGAARLGSLQSHRYDYWRVAGGAFAAHPVAGVGAGGFRVEWLRERPFPEPAQDAHSLYVETAAELGLVGLAALALLLGGVALAARRALRRAPGAAAGPCAALAAWAMHAGIDWDWELPAVTLLAVVLAGACIAGAEAEEDAPGRAALSR